MQTVREITDPSHIKILVDEKRQEVLNVLRNSKQAMTVKQISEKLGVKPANVHFHVKKLEDIGILHLVKTEEIHGIIAKYYEPTAMIFKLSCKELDPGTVMKVNLHFASGAEQLFEESKQKFIALSNRKEGGAKRYSSSELFLAREEFIELNDMIDQAIDRFKERREDKQRLYHFFISCIMDSEQEKPCDE